MLGMLNTQGSTVVAAPQTYLTRVVRTCMITPRVRRITLGGAGLGRFPTVGADEFVSLLLPPAGRSDLTVGPGFEWADVRAMPRSERPRGAYYSVRHHRPADHELDLDIVIHDGGAASTWAADAGPGDPAALWGPRVLFRPPDDTAWLLLLADDTGVPAMLSILEHLVSPVPVVAIAEVATAGEVRAVELPPTVDLRWLCRDDLGPTTCQVVRTLRRPDGPGYAWGGGEHTWTRELDRLLALQHDMGDEQRSLTSYWRRGSRTGLR